MYSDMLVGSLPGDYKAAGSPGVVLFCHQLLSRYDFVGATIMADLDTLFHFRCNFIHYYAYNKTIRYLKVPAPCATRSTSHSPRLDVQDVYTTVQDSCCIRRDVSTA